MHSVLDPVYSHLARTYGGKRAALSTLLHEIRCYTGQFQIYSHIDWSRISRVVFVCKGNICRSAFAEHRCRSLGGIASSAGLEADTGKPANHRAIETARRWDTDLTAHRSTHIRERELRAHDLLVAFEPDHADMLRTYAKAAPGAQVTLLGLWPEHGTFPYLHDPYGMSPEYFVNCFERIDRGLSGMLRRLAGALALGGKRA